MTKPAPCTLELTSDQREVVGSTLYSHFFACENHIRSYRTQLAEAASGKADRQFTSDLRGLAKVWEWRLRNTIAVCELLDVDLPLPPRIGDDDE